MGDAERVRPGASPRPSASCSGPATSPREHRGRSCATSAAAARARQLRAPPRRRRASCSRELLGVAPGVRVLATSREGLGVAGERVWPLRSLDRAGRSMPTSTSSRPSDAVRALRRPRRRGAAGLRRSTETNAARSREICRRLDGIPLAIELAAARATIDDPGRDRRSRLDERFRLLTGGRRTAVERHQTLREPSTGRTTSSMPRTCAEPAGVFAGSFDLDAAESVATGDGLEGSTCSTGSASSSTSRCSSPRPARRHPIPTPRDDPPVRLRTTRPDRRGRRVLAAARGSLHRLRRGRQDRHRRSRLSGPD